MVVCACVVRALAEQRAELTSNTFGWWMFKTAPGSICSWVKNRSNNFLNVKKM